MTEPPQTTQPNGNPKWRRKPDARTRHQQAGLWVGAWLCIVRVGDLPECLVGKSE